MKTIPLTQRPTWRTLENHYLTIKDIHLRNLFDEDPQRGERLSVQAVGLYADYSKHRVTDETLRLLLDLARESGLEERRESMFTGEKINLTEKRAVLHTARQTHHS
jgi:glucose-6-phosphate isomerase